MFVNAMYRSCTEDEHSLVEKAEDRHSAGLADFLMSLRIADCVVKHCQHYYYYYYFLKGSSSFEPCVPFDCTIAQSEVLEHKQQQHVESFTSAVMSIPNSGHDSKHEISAANASVPEQQQQPEHQHQQHHEGKFGSLQLDVPPPTSGWFSWLGIG